MSTIAILTGIAIAVWLLHLMQRDQAELLTHVRNLLDVAPGEDWPDDDWPDDDPTPEGLTGGPIDLRAATDRTLRYAEQMRTSART